MPRTYRPEEIHHPLICCESIRCEAGQVVAEVGRIEGRADVDGAGKKTFAEGAIGNEADPELLQGGQDLRLWLADPKRVLALKCGDRLYRVGAANRPRACLGEPKI